MTERKQFFKKLFLAVSILATLFVVVEIALQSFGKSICATEGCKTTAQYARFGDISILLIGLATFFSVAALTLLNRRARKAGIERLINLILIVALTGEGFFMGFLAFKIHTFCLFCFIIFCFMATLGALRILSGERDVAAAFATLATVFLMHYLILPAGVTAKLPANDRLVLFYSKDCKHCSEIIKELDEKKIAVTHLPVSEYGGILKNVGIDFIPTLMVNDPNQKVFLTGKEMIRRYLMSCTESKKPVEKAGQKKQAGKAVARPARDTGVTLDIFNQPGLLTMPSQSTPDAGLCKEEEICK
jgi:uncharacterized membrane protein YhaH (DUF805 family)